MRRLILLLPLIYAVPLLPAAEPQGGFTPPEAAKRMKPADGLVVKLFAAQQIVATYQDSDEFTQHIRQETDKWAKVIKTAGIKAE